MVLKLMLRFLICGSLLFTLFSKRGSTQPARCQVLYSIEEDRSSFVIVPGVTNCFSCALHNESMVSWLASIQTGDLLPASTVPIIEIEANYLILPDPTDYVEPGNAGRRDIICTTGNQQLEARLTSPELVPPILYNTTALEGRELILTCINRNPTETSTVHMYDPNGAEISSNTGPGIFTISNITRRYAGEYTCVVISTVYADYNVTTTATVIILAPPSRPLNLYTEGVGANALYVMWEQPLNDGGKPIVSYRVAILESFVTYDVSSTALNVLVRNEYLTENTTYIVTVRAANEVGLGDIAIAIGTTQSIIEPQRIFDQPALDNITSTSALVMWKFPGGTVEAYIVQFVLAVYSFDSNNVKNVTVGGSETSVVIGNLLPVATYRVRVTVINSRGTSIFSPSISFTTQCSCTPPIVTDITVLEGTTIILNCTSTIESVNFTWSKDLDLLPENSYVIPTHTYLRIKMVTIQNAGRYICTAYDANNDTVAYNDFVLNVQPNEDNNKDQFKRVIIIVGGILATVVIFAVVILVINFKLVAIIKSKTKKYPIEAKVHNVMEAKGHMEVEYDIVGQASTALKTERNIAYSKTFKQEKL